LGEVEKHYFLDTNYLLNFLSFRNKKLSKVIAAKHEQIQVANSVIKSLEKHIKVPIIVVAETVHQLHELGVNVGISELMVFETSYLKREHLCYFVKLMHKLSEKDPMLESMDCMIVAFSLADPQCVGLLTFDANLHSNRAIQDVLRETFTDRDFVITDDPRSRKR